jgi:DHA1 family multidrug resistance protein-like MFS transporter
LFPKPKNPVVVLSVSIFVQFLGAMAISPILPIFLKHTSQKEYSIGLIIGLFFAFDLLAQYPTGRYVDKHSPLHAIVFGLTTFVVGSALMGIANNFIELVIYRSLQGIGSGAFLVATNSLIAKSGKNENKTKSFAYIFGAQMSGTTIGALLGSTFGLNHLRATFFFAAGLSLISLIFTIVNLKLIQTSHENSKMDFLRHDELRKSPSDSSDNSFSGTSLMKNPAVLGAIIWAVSSGSISGVYETLWSPYFLSRGGNGLMLGLSWFCFGAPYILFSWNLDKIFKHVKLSTLALAQPIFGGLFIIIYVTIHNIDLMVALCAVEAIVVLPGSPAIQTILTRSISYHHQGHAQGIILSFQIASQAVFAFGSGLLATHNITLSFYVGGIISIILTGPLVASLRQIPQVNAH